MKRTIIALLVTLVAVQANAQLKVSKSQVDKPEKVETLYQMWNWLNRNGDVYYLTARSTNRYDNHYMLMLGKTYEECLSSLDALEELVTTMSKTDSYDIDNGFGSAYTATLYSEMGTQGLSLSGDGFAEPGILFKVSIRKAIGWVRQNLKPAKAELPDTDIR